MDTQSARLLDTPSLAAECAEQTARFYQRQVSNPDFCFELFRRAILKREPTAWDALIAQYRPQIERWIRRVGPTDAETIEDLTQDAITRFLRAYGAEDLARASSLAAVLRYWQDCARSAVLDWQRKRPWVVSSLDSDEDARLDIVRSHENVEGQVARHEAGQRLWQLVRQHCQDETDVLLAHRVFVEGYRPREVYAENTPRFATQTEVYQRLRNLKDRLRRDPAVQSLREELNA